MLELWIADLSKEAGINTTRIVDFDASENADVAEWLYIPCKASDLNPLDI